MPRVGFEPTIPVFERAKTVHVLDRAATVIGNYALYSPQPNVLFFYRDFSFSPTLLLLFRTFPPHKHSQQKSHDEEEEPANNYHVCVPRSQLRTQSVIIQICDIMYHVDRFK
jgi:hypothetical protein